MTQILALASFFCIWPPRTLIFFHGGEIIRAHKSHLLPHESSYFVSFIDKEKETLWIVGSSFKGCCMSMTYDISYMRMSLSPSTFLSLYCVFLIIVYVIIVALIEFWLFLLGFMVLDPTFFYKFKPLILFSVTLTTTSW